MTAAALTADGVQPTGLDHERLADLWLATVVPEHVPAEVQQDASRLAFESAHGRIALVTDAMAAGGAGVGH